jgi:hypothetical protein
VHDRARAARAISRLGIVALLVGPVAAVPAAAEAQPTLQRGSRPEARLQPELRADFIDARAEAAHLGAGLNVRFGTYVRFAVVGAAGRTWEEGASGVAGRVDGLVRFVADPLRESRWAPYASGGVGALYDESERWRGVLVGLLGIEGPAGGGVVPAFELGFGGGARLGIVLRRALPGRR